MSFAERLRWTDFRDGFVKPAVALVVAYYTGGLVSGWLLASTELGCTVAGSAIAGMAGAATGGFAAGAIVSGNIEGALQGSFTAVVFAGAGDLISGGTVFGASAPIEDSLAQAAIHGVAGCVTNEVGGGKCGPGAAAAAFSKFATVNGFVGKDAVSGTITSAVIGGTAAELGGGKFANGAQTAAFAYLFNELQHCMASQNCMKTAGYEPTYYRNDGILCNGPGDPSCRSPGAIGDSTGQVGATGGWAAGIGLGGSVEFGRFIGTDGLSCTMQSTCLLVGPYAGYSIDLGVAAGEGLPSNGWQISGFGRASWSVLGGEAALSYSGDGLGMQYSKSVWGQMFGAGVKACVQQVHGCSPPPKK